MVQGKRKSCSGSSDPPLQKSHCPSINSADPDPELEQGPSRPALASPLKPATTQLIQTGATPSKPGAIQVQVSPMKPPFKPPAPGTPLKSAACPHPQQSPRTSHPQQSTLTPHPQQSPHAPMAPQPYPAWGPMPGQYGPPASMQYSPSPPYGQQYHHYPHYSPYQYPRHSQQQYDSYPGHHKSVTQL